MECTQSLAPPASQSKQIPRPRRLCACPVALSALSLSFRSVPLKIKMVMLAASRIKRRSARRTPRLTLQILPNRQLHPARPAQNRPLLPLLPRPNRNSMPRHLLMAILASPIHAATPHLDRNNIHSRPPMRAPRLRIHLHPPHPWPFFIENDVLLSATIRNEPGSSASIALEPRLIVMLPILLRWQRCSL
jgi:hypothetical protein